MLFNTTFTNISVISWRSVLLVAEIGGPGENNGQVTDKLYHIILYTLPWSRFELTSVVIGTNCIGSYKSNYHTITTTTPPSGTKDLIIISLIIYLFLPWYSWKIELNGPLYCLLFYDLHLLITPLVSSNLFYLVQTNIPP